MYLGSGAVKNIHCVHSPMRGIAMETIYLETKEHTSMIDITEQVRDAVKQSGVKSGICTIFVPHTTAAVTINENADPDVVLDFKMEIDKLVPWEDYYRHCEGNSAAHIKASMMGFSENVIIENGTLVLGTWQGIYFLEYDGPRRRKVFIKVMEG